MKYPKKSLSKTGDKNPMWEGDNVGYFPLHNWVRRHKLKPKFCERCGKNKPYDLANISQKYKRNVNDFEWICRSCHMKKDGRTDNLHKNKRRKHKVNLILCTKCKEFKPKEEFYKDKSKWDGLNLNCKECIKEHNQKPEAITKRREYQKYRYKKNKNDRRNSNFQSEV